MSERFQRSQAFPGCGIRLGGGRGKSEVCWTMVVLMASVVKVGFCQTTFVYARKRTLQRECPRPGLEEKQGCWAETRAQWCRVLQKASWPPHSVSTLSRQTPWSLVCTRQPAGLTDLTWRGFPISSFLIPADFSRILSFSLFYLHQSFPRLGSPCLSISNLEKCVDGLLNVLKLWSVGNARWGYGHVGAWKRQLTVGNLHRECWRNRPLSSWCLDSDWNGFQLSELFLVVFARTPHSTAI